MQAPPRQKQTNTETYAQRESARAKGRGREKHAHAQKQTRTRRGEGRGGGRGGGGGGGGLRAYNRTTSGPDHVTSESGAPITPDALNAPCFQPLQPTMAIPASSYRTNWNGKDLTENGFGISCCCVFPRVVRVLGFNQSLGTLHVEGTRPPRVLPRARHLHAREPGLPRSRIRRMERRIIDLSAQIKERESAVRTSWFLQIGLVGDDRASSTQRRDLIGHGCFKDLVGSGVKMLLQLQYVA